MNLFKNKTEERDSFSAYLDVLTSATGLSSKNEVLSVPSAKLCIDKIAGCISSMDIKLYNGVEEVVEHNVLNILRKPNLVDTYNTLMTKLVADLIIEGRAYAYVSRDFNTVTGIHYIDPLSVSITKRTSGVEVVGIDFMVNNEPYDIDDILVFTMNGDGLSGTGLRVLGKELLTLSKSELNLANSFFKNGSHIRGVLTTPTRLSVNAMDNLKKSFSAIYSGSDKAGKTIVLEGDMKYSNMSLNPQELELTQSRSITDRNICYLLGVPFSFLEGTVTDTEYLNFLRNTIDPIVTMVEEQLTDKLLLASEQQKGMYLTFDVESSYRMTPNSKADYVEKAIKSGVMTINEARQMLGRRPIKKDTFLLSLGNVLFDPETNEYVVLNLNEGNGNIPNNKLTNKDEISINQ